MNEFLIGNAFIFAYFIIFASIAITIRLLIKIPDEIFRKLLHFILLGSLFVFVFAFKTWWVSALSAILFVVIVFPILFFLERYKMFSKTVTERKKGELKSSLVLVFFMFAVVISVCWGWLGDKYLVIASIYAWGIGDALAALIGKKFGKRRINWKYIDGRKSFEGTISMFVSCLITVAVILAFRGNIHISGYFVIPILTSVICSAVELYTPNGLDTIACPLSAMIVILPLIELFGKLL